MQGQGCSAAGFGPREHLVKGANYETEVDCGTLKKNGRTDFTKSSKCIPGPEQAKHICEREFNAMMSGEWPGKNRKER